MTQSIQKRDERAVEYIAFGSDAKVKLNIAIVQNQCAKRTKKGETCSEADAIKFIMLCQARALNPFEGDAYLIGFDSQDGPEFNMITSEQAFLKRAEASAEYDGMRSGIIVRDGSGTREVESIFFEEGEQVVGGWCEVYFKTKKYPQKEKVRIQPYQNRVGAGPLWKSNPERMIQKVAESLALRKAFPTKLGGLYTESEVQVHEDRFQAAKPAVVTRTESFLPPPTQTIDTDVPIDMQPEKPKEPPVKEAKVFTQAEMAGQLSTILVENDIAVATFWNWLGQSAFKDQVPDSISQLEEIPTPVLKRIVASRVGLVQQIKGGLK